MSNFIHPSAIIEPGAEFGENNYIGPYSDIGPNVKMGSNNRLEGHVSIGTPAEHRDYLRKTPGPVSIGDNNVFREFCTINGGTYSTTTLGNDIIMMRGCALGHDSIIRDKVTLSFNVLIAGHVIVGTGANLGLSACVHQFRVIGAFTMVGMNSTVTKNTLPYVIAYGNAAEPVRVNRIGLMRNGVPEGDLNIFEEWFVSHQGLYTCPKELNHSLAYHLKEFHEDVKVISQSKN